jgi:hypothetical protein
MSSKKDGTNRTGDPKPGDAVEVTPPPTSAVDPAVPPEAPANAENAPSEPAVAEIAPAESPSEIPARDAPDAETVASDAEPVAGEAPSEPVAAEVTASEAVPAGTAAEAEPAEPVSSEAEASAPEQVASAPEPVVPQIAPPAAPAAGGSGIGRLLGVAALSTVLGGVIGIGGSQFLSSRDEAAARAAIEAQIAAGLAKSSARIADLEARVAALPKAPPAFDPTPLDKRIAALEGERTNTGNLVERVGAVEKSLREQIEAARNSVTAALAAVPADGSTKAALEAMAARLDSGLDAARAKSDEIAAAGKALGDRLAADFDRKAVEAAKVLDGVRTRLGALESLRGDVDGLIGRIGGVEETAKALKAAGATAFDQIGKQAGAIAEKLGGVDGRVGKLETGAAGVAKAQAGAVLAVALADLKSAVDAGRPFKNEFDVVRRAGTLDLKVLEPFVETGVPSVTALRERLPKVTRTIADLQETAEAGDGIVDRLVAHAKQIVRIRPAGSAAGDTVDARLSRLEAKTRAGDLAGALDEWKGLPDAAKKPVADWGTALEARVGVDKALARETAAVLAELSKSTPAR